MEEIEPPAKRPRGELRGLAKAAAEAVTMFDPKSMGLPDGFLLVNYAKLKG